MKSEESEEHPISLSSVCPLEIGRHEEKHLPCAKDPNTSINRHQKIKATKVHPKLPGHILLQDLGVRTIIGWLEHCEDIGKCDAGSVVKGVEELKERKVENSKEITLFQAFS